ncbi:uncharacterized protein MONOS_2980 [Monocercomonoides exilis]|uniref:uncharacterized protein n=1 Tax=Monocercomonoides exilis TaxID=2049356 RepID=UPI00355979E8|nr:hypothetical protein MONOS_2980 [Monocercomonoides exilis]|eukprot:MONOS_2980.1-p1 / transcript=MONOS_2980.1 / gene=MONOS_2980 / organism=Monocercomonoides_exilis_PA203 / gene_product=unspecified product / transcript_product=unspecified product / location=Mono_scaffold00066:10018-11621(-) / protein_length=246 / sequence_SO=supercontig / SO=protein_coding / is_pseudo=false
MEKALEESEMMMKDEVMSPAAIALAVLEEREEADECEGNEEKGGYPIFQIERADSGCAGRAVHATDHKLLEDINEMAKIQLRNKAKEESDFGAVRDFHAAWDRERSSGEAGDCGRFGDDSAKVKFTTEKRIEASRQSREGEEAGNVKEILSNCSAMQSVHAFEDVSDGASHADTQLIWLAVVPMDAPMALKMAAENLHYNFVSSSSFSSSSSSSSSSYSSSSTSPSPSLSSPSSPLITTLSPSPS